MFPDGCGNPLHDYIIVPIFMLLLMLPGIRIIVMKLRAKFGKQKPHDCHDPDCHKP